MATFHHLIGATATSIALVLNSFLLVIILKYSSDKLGVYKHFLFAYTLNAVYYCFIQLLLLENFYVPEVDESSPSSFIFFSTLAIVPRTFQNWVLTSFVASYDYNLLIVGWSFLYRLSIVTESNLFRSKPKLCVLLVISLCIWIVETYNIVASLPTPEADEYFAEMIWNVTGNDISGISYVGGPFFWKDGSFNYTIVICLLAHGGYYTTFTIFVGICWVKIRRGLKVMQSKAAHHFNRKIYILLTLQTIFPMVFNSSPVVITFVCATMKWFVGDYLLISGAVLSFAQVIDPLCIMMLVSDYKNAIKEALGMVVLASRISSRVHSIGS